MGARASAADAFATMMQMESRRMCPHCRAFITTRDRVCPYCGERVGPRAIEARSPADVLGGLIPHARFTTVVLLVVNFGLYVATVLYSAGSGNENAWMGVDGATLFRFGAKYGPAIAAGEWWRLITAGFLHGGLLHIFMNSWVLFDLGAQVEEVYGTARYLLIYILSTIGGFLASMLWRPTLSIGASAAVFGLIGAMIALGVRRRSGFGDAIRGMYLRWAIYGMVFGLLPGLRIDNAAHLGGLAVGYGVAYVAGEPRIPSAPREKVMRVLAWLAVAMTVFAFATVYLTFSRPLRLV
jgi:rhomboid protease GluP